MKNRSSYVGAMYAVARHVLPRNYYDGSENVENIEVKNVITTLASSECSYLVDSVLSSEGFSTYQFDNIIHGYVQLEQFDRIIQLMDRFPKYAKSSSIFSALTILANLPDTDEVILGIISRMELESTEYLHALKAFWSHKRPALIDRIIDGMSNVGCKAVLHLVHDMIQGKSISSQDSATAIQLLFDACAPKGRFDYETKGILEGYLGHFFEQCIAHGVSVDSFEAAYFVYVNHKESRRIWIMNEYAYCRQIISRHISLHNFAAAEAFAQCTNMTDYFDGDISYAKMKFYKQEGNREMYRGAMMNVLRKKDVELAECQSKMEAARALEEEGEVAESVYDGSWNVRSKIFVTTAMRHCELAIFEFLFGDEATAQEQMHLMIENIEAVTRSIPKESTKRQRRHIQGKVKAPAKRRIKRRFQELGLFHVLPAEFGWNAPVKSELDEEHDREVRMQQRELKSLRDSELYQLSEARSEAMKISKIHELMVQGEYEKAKELTTPEDDRYSTPTRVDWRSAMVIIEFRPDQFMQIFEKMSKHYFERIDYYSRNYDFEGLAMFFLRGYSLGLVDELAWGKLIEGLNNSRKDREDGRSLPAAPVVALVKGLLEMNEFDTAWWFYSSLEKLPIFRGRMNIGGKTASTCLSLFIEHAPEDQKAQYAQAFDNNSEGTDNLVAENQWAIWNVRANLASILGQKVRYDESVHRLQQLLVAGHNPEASIRCWTQDMETENFRNHHQMRDEAGAIIASSIGQTEKIRRRIQYMMMNLNVPGMEGSSDVKRKDSPLLAQVFFFRKLVQKKYLSEKTLTFLGEDWKQHIYFLRQILAQYQNEFNTIMEVVSADGEFTPKQWKNVFLVLRHVGVITPGVWSQAKSTNFHVGELSALSRRIYEAKKVIFRNMPLAGDISSDLHSELIYQAFKPANMSYHEIMFLLTRVQDCTGHLDKYTFPAEGVPLEIHDRAQVSFRKGKSENGGLNNVGMEYGAGSPAGEENNRTMARVLSEVGKMNFAEFDKIGMSIIFSIFSGDSLLQSARMARWGGTQERYQSLCNMRDFLAVYLPDNLENRILQFFANTSDTTSVIWKRFIDSLHQGKRRESIQEQLKITIPHVVDEKFAAFVISKIILTRSSVLRSLKKAVNEEIRNYVNIDGGELSYSGKRLRVFFSKNQASFFAKASAGLCTGADTGSFHMPHHIHINLVDEQKQECVGNLMAYDMYPNTGKKILLLRGFNPNMSILKEIDVASYCNAMLKIADEFARNNGFEAVCICNPTGGWHALSNRIEVSSYLMNRYGAKSIEINFPITSQDFSQTTAKLMHPVYDYSNAAPEEVGV